MHDCATRRMLHWRSSCCQTGCNERVPRDLPRLADMPHTQYPTVCMTHRHTHTSQSGYSLNILNIFSCKIFPPNLQYNHFTHLNPDIFYTQNDEISVTRRQTHTHTSTHRMVLSEEPLTTSLSLYCRQAIPRLCPFSVRTNSQVLVLHTWTQTTITYDIESQ